MSTLTTFIPAYDRIHLLDRLYVSLKRQTSNDFCWLIIDGGSTDERAAYRGGVSGRWIIGDGAEAVFPASPRVSCKA